jgi:acyl-CoA synthetase (AMP-forming)/AMP-acid ligase II
MLALIAPDGELFPPYGATESLPVAMMSSNEILAETWAETEKGAGVCVGPPVPSIQLRVIAITDEAIADPALATDCAVGEVGEIAVCGDVVTTGYLNDEGADARSKMVSASGELWHRMGDMGYLDAAGQLYFCGRRVHVVTTKDRMFHSVPVENVFNTHPQVSRTALVAVDGLPALVVEPRSRLLSMDARQRLADELRALGAHDPVTASIRRFYFHPSFPVDARHNAKIFRDRLAVWAATQAAIEIDGPGAPNASRA